MAVADDGRGCCKMEIRFTINGNLPTLNEYTNANRRNRYAGAKMKVDAETLIAHYIKMQGVPSTDQPFELHIDWYEKDKRKDSDNVASGCKFLLDSMTACGIIPNDSRRYLTDICHKVRVDKDNPRIEVCIRSPQAQGDV